MLNLVLHTVTTGPVYSVAKHFLALSYTLEAKTFNVIKDDLLECAIVERFVANFRFHSQNVMLKAVVGFFP
jgi:hypothetical protein